MSSVARTQKDRGEALRINELQVIGTHNSYHAGLAPSQNVLVEKSDPVLAKALDYRHPALNVQLATGVRELELDVFLDTVGGKYAHPAGLAQVEREGLPSDPPYDQYHLLARPGFKVMHNADYDYRSNCQPFTTCLAIIRKWSLEHPNHIPIFIFVENKRFGDLTTRDLDGLDKEILSVFAKSELIRPDDVRGNHKTLRDAVTTTGWPTLAESRGKVIFLLAKEELRKTYTSGHPSLEDRVLFTNSKPDGPDAAFMVLPESSDPRIPEMVKRGFLVLTRTDIDTVEGRTNSVGRKDRALASGAQLLSTDYPPVEPARWTGYQVSFQDSDVARCNPVLIQAACRITPFEVPN